MVTKIFIGIGVALTISAALYIYLRKKSKNGKLEEEFVEGELSFETIVSYLKTLNLNQQTDTPFMAVPMGAKGASLFETLNLPKLKEGYRVLLIGVYNETDGSISNAKLIFAKSFDSETMGILGEDDFVVLH